MDHWHAFDRYVADALDSWHCPGVAIAVVRGDDVVYRAAHGLRDVERQLPLTPDSRFAMASVTKSFTAMSVALLVDEGRLAWDVPVREFLPELVLSDPYVTAHLTLRDMLSHRSGLPRHDLAAWRLDLPRAEFVKRLRHLRFSAGFRERYQYNNLMYYTVAHLVDRVAGVRWEDFVRARIFEPLGMTASNFLPDPPQAGQPTALGYRVERDEQGAASGLVATPFGAHTELSPGAAGALFSTLDDQVRWLGVQANGGRWGDVRLVSPDTCAQMHLPVTVKPGGGAKEALMGNPVFTYAMGWSVEPYRGHTLAQHGGNVEGHSLMVGFVPRERVGVVVLSNVAQLPLRDALLYEALDHALGLEGRDWNARFHDHHDPLLRAAAHGKRDAAQGRVADAPPGHPLEAYAGAYRADGYPDLAVRRAGDELQARLVGSLDWAPLRHVHFEAFEWDLSDFFDTTLRVRFLTDEHGEVEAVAVPIEPEVADATFRRRPLALPAEVAAAVLGTYDTPIEGLTFTVAAGADRILVTQAGATATTIEPYRLEDDAIWFRAKRTRYEFVREGERVTRLLVRGSGLTLEARRQP